MKTRMMRFVVIAFLSALIHVPESRAQAWTNLGSGMNSNVWKLACDRSDNLYASGWFTNAGGVAANYIAKWDGASWSSLGSGLNTFVYALAFDANGHLYAGGGFTNAGSVAANYIAKWDGSSWSSLGGGMSSAKAALESDTRTLAWQAGRKWNLRVNAISAGAFQSRAAKAIGMIDDMIQYAKANAPLCKDLEGEEVGHTAAFLLSPLASAITGTVLFVDNGIHAMGLAIDSAALQNNKIYSSNTPALTT